MAYFVLKSLLLIVTIGLIILGLQIVKKDNKNDK